MSHVYIALRLANFYLGGEFAIGAIERYTLNVSKLTKRLVYQDCPDAQQE